MTEEKQMTVGELIEILIKFDPSLKVRSCGRDEYEPLEKEEIRVSGSYDDENQLLIG